MGESEDFHVCIMKPTSTSSATIKELTAIVLLVAGIVMAFIALMLPPPGEIHDSVLYIFAQILIYCGSIFGIDSYIKTLLTSHQGRDKRNDEK